MKIKVFVHAKYGDIFDAKTTTYNKGFRYTAWPYTDASCGTLVCERELNIPDVDENELRNGTVKLLKAKQQEIRAKCETDVQEIEQQIQEMLCLPAEVTP